MRLLHYNEVGDLLFTSFEEGSVPPYAILSHRWGIDEVVFGDLHVEYDLVTKHGYHKIEFCGKQAAQDQLQYFWIDTCCIDKWNVEELSESINSMFLWYKNAAKCYVFLPDVSVPNESETDRQSNWETSFRASQWFTRGWTLQELIAPDSVEFFSAEGYRLGDKISLRQCIHEVTNIPMLALEGHPLESFSASEKMEWGRNRETKEDEDKVYCLLGILGISMPISYGEGRESAQRKLQLELDSTDNAAFIVPFSRNHGFVGRDSQLIMLEKLLCKQESTATVAISGSVGTGKSQLALELAYRVHKQLGKSVFWADASNIDTLNQSYATIARKLKLNDSAAANAEPKYGFKHYLSEKRSGEWLLVFDNAIETDLSGLGSFTMQSSVLLDYLPQSASGSVIFTTSNTEAGKQLQCQHVVELGGLTIDEARKMLESSLITPLTSSESDEVVLLLEELSHFPFAIVQASAFMNHTDTSIQDYRLQLLGKRAQVSKSSLTKDSLQPHLSNDTIKATVALSVDYVRLDEPLAAEILFLAACVRRKDIPLDLLEAFESSEREDAVKLLSSYELITRRPAEDSLDM
jgi:hypothetical protein